MNVWAILACRARSERLYCKPLQKVGPGTILDQVIGNIASVRGIDGIVLAIAEGRSNECFLDFAEERRLPYVVGSELNILDRVLVAVERYRIETMFRVTTECPFLYTREIGSVVSSHVQEGYVFTTVVELPLGTSYELIRTSVLRDAAATGEPRYQGALSLFIRENQDRYRVRLLKPIESCRRPELNFAVDHPEQLVFARRAFRALCSRGLPIDISNLIRYWDENPVLAELIISVHEDVYAVRPDHTMARVW